MLQLSQATLAAVEEEEAEPPRKKKRERDHQQIQQANHNLFMSNSIFVT